MTHEELSDINRDRLDRWCKRLDGEHATAALTVGIGHDHRCGDIVILALENGPMSDTAALAALLHHAATELEKRGKRGKKAKK